MMVPYNGSPMPTGDGLAMAPGGDDAMTAGAMGGVTPTHLMMAAADMNASGRLSQIMNMHNARAQTKRR